MTIKEKKQAEAREILLACIKEGEKIGIAIKSVSQSGMSRRMRVYTQNFRDITYYVADLCDLSLNETGLKISGCGMDMTFWLANNITYNLWPNEADRPKWLTGNGGGCLAWAVL